MKEEKKLKIKEEDKKKNKKINEQFLPFEVTDSLKLALSSTQPTEIKLNNQLKLNDNKINSILIEQENNLKKKENYIKNFNNSSSIFIIPTITTTTNIYSSSFFSFFSKKFSSLQKNKLKNNLIMPGAHFYVDQHVSHGRFGREPPLNPKFVYDPNVLQNRYGYNGILSQLLPNGKLARFGTGIVNHKQNGVVLLNQQQQTNINIPSELEISPSQFSSIKIFFFFF
ncbi:hypothetical protein Mgra_00001866 [Meloidogyne graminicola]|uniref:Uncharacterized protein n=1 Tax=Meloidogyne graminicola TaxID=189291 RepID=A0A8T0A042_9BILA|nr:hypothetical protein Mgra_00001866 [Meloidogyne graminicola]